jgi:hypothetical protein
MMRRLMFAMVMLLVAIGCKKSKIDEVVEPKLIVDVQTIDLSYKAQSVEILYDSNLKVEVSSIFWVVVDSVEGGKIVLTVMENGTGALRSAKVVITAGELSHTVTINQQPKPDMMTLGLGHRSKYLDSPVWGGESLSGTIDWGDGTQEPYSEGVSHEYADSEPRTARFEMLGAESFRIERVGDIESVELTL